VDNLRTGLRSECKSRRETAARKLAALGPEACTPDVLKDLMGGPRRPSSRYVPTWRGINELMREGLRIFRSGNGAKWTGSTVQELSRIEDVAMPPTAAAGVPSAGVLATPVETDDLRAEERDLYVFEKIDEMTIKVRFEGEEGSIKGKAAFRLHKLVRAGRLHLFELSGDLEAAEGRGSMVPRGELTDKPDENDSGNHFRKAKHAPNAKRAIPRLKKKLEEVEQDLATASEGLERYELEEKKQEILYEIGLLMDVSRSSIEKARERVDRLHRKLKADCLEKMPGFVKHLEDTIHFDTTTDTYCYSPLEEVSWQFKGFTDEEARDSS
jgi:hypothetical protein